MALTDTVDLFGNVTWTEAEDAAGARALRVPLRDLELGVNAQLGMNTQGSLSLNHVMDRVDTVGAVPDYTLVNANISHQLNDTTQAYLRVVNLLDEDYETAAGYATSGPRVLFRGPCVLLRSYRWLSRWF